jgi:copper(I)-binding protein
MFRSQGKHSPRRLVPWLAGLWPAQMFTLGPAAAEGLAMQDAWARASLGGARNAIVYGTIMNRGAGHLRLVGADTPVAGRVEFHLHAMDGEVMTMRRIDGIDLKSGESVTLKPGGLHIMLVDLKRPLKEGESFPLTLIPAEGTGMVLTVKVLGATALGPAP